MQQWLTPTGILKLVAHDNAQSLALSGPRRPHPGNSDVVHESASADPRPVAGDPPADPALVANPKQDFRVIMRDGQRMKNTTKAVR